MTRHVRTVICYRSVCRREERQAVATFDGDGVSRLMATYQALAARFSCVASAFQLERFQIALSYIVMSGPAARGT